MRACMNEQHLHKIKSCVSRTKEVKTTGHGHHCGIHFAPGKDTFLKGLTCAQHGSHFQILSLKLPDYGCITNLGSTSCSLD